MPRQYVDTCGSGLVKELSFKKRECKRHTDDFAVGQQVASFAFQCSLMLFFLYHRMPRFEEGGLSPLEDVISWQRSLEPPPSLTVGNCLPLDPEADLRVALMQMGRRD